MPAASFGVTSVLQCGRHWLGSFGERSAALRQALDCGLHQSILIRRHRGDGKFEELLLVVINPPWPIFIVRERKFQRPETYRPRVDVAGLNQPKNLVAEFVCSGDVGTRGV
jgi:hypothetical protein